VNRHGWQGGGFKSSPKEKWIFHPFPESENDMPKICKEASINGYPLTSRDSPFIVSIINNYSDLVPISRVEKKEFEMAIISNKQAIDSGMALVLMAILLFLFFGERAFLYAAIVFHALNMTVPKIFKPFAKLWFGLSHWLGVIVSTILLATVFYGVITPIGFISRLAGHDPLRLKQFKNGMGSVFVERKMQYTKDDLAKPY
jgi:hypothetical protein